MCSKHVAMWIAFTLLTTGCSFIDLTPLVITTVPEEAGCVLRKESEIFLTFSLPVEAHTTEGLFSLEDNTGMVEGDFCWDENSSFTFIPMEKLQPGTCYTLSFQGEVRTLDGRMYDKDIYLPFYYITDKSPPLLLSSGPADAETVGVHQDLTLTFNRGMESKSVEEAFTVRPATELLFEWNTESSAVVITPENQWTNLQYHTWTLAVDAADTEGIAIPTAYTGSFLVQKDTIAPELISTHPALDNNNGTFTVLTSQDLNNLTNNTHITLLFSEEIEFSSLVGCLDLDPSLDGYLISLTPRQALYYILESIPPEQEYILTIGEGLEDPAGNVNPEDVEIIFTPDVPILQILSIVIDHDGGTHTLTPEDCNLPDPLIISDLAYYGTSPDFSLVFSIALSSAFPANDPAARNALVETISLLPVFPPDTEIPDRHLISWLSDTVVQFQFRDLSECTSDEPVYYRLTISSGNEDSSGSDGAWLQENLSCVFRGGLE